MKRYRIAPLIILCAAAGPAAGQPAVVPPPPAVVPPPPRATPPRPRITARPAAPVAAVAAASTRTAARDLADICKAKTVPPALKGAACAGMPAGAGLAAEPAFPPGYYSARLHVDVCQAVAGMSEKQDDPAVGDAVLHLHHLCGHGEVRAADLNAFGVQLVQGLGDFLVVRAKEELVAFAVEVKAKSLCEGPFKAYLPKTCAVLFPPPPGSPPDLDSATDGRLQTAIRADLTDLPDKLLDVAIKAVEAKVNDPVLDKVIEAVGKAALLTLEDGDLLHFFDVALAQLPADASTTFACQLAATPPSVPACLGAFSLEVGSTAVAERGSDPMRILNDAADSFCTRFGPPGQTTPGQCIFGAANYATAIQPAALAIVGSAVSLAKSSDHINEQVSQSPLSLAEISAKVSPTVVSGLRTALAALAPALKMPASPAGTAAIDGVLKLIGDIVDFASAIAARDSGEALAAAEDLVQDLAALDPRLVLDSKTFAFILAIGTAKSRDDVEAAFEAAAEPLGSYRAKYGPNSGGRVTINGFVGPAVGLLRPLHRDGSVDKNQFFERLSAPVGLDVNVAGGDLTNFGFGLRLIDPLGLTVVTRNDGTVTANWASLVDLGAYLRFGLFRSPLSLLVSFDYFPGLEPRDACTTASGASPCWRGAWLLGGAISVDIPLLAVH